ncbi:hypothetical protein ACFLXD_04015 [Chloroflexota bacterium]
MQERSTGITRDDLYTFLKFAGERNLINKSTIANRERACKHILGILDETEAADLSKIDLEDIISRHKIKAASKIPPSSLTGYESHVRGAVRDFLEYVRNPSSWRPSIQPRSRRATTPTQAATKPRSRTLASKPEEIISPPEIPTQPSVHIDFQIHISPESTPEQIDKIFESMSRHFTGK